VSTNNICQWQHLYPAWSPGGQRSQCHFALVTFYYRCFRIITVFQAEVELHLPSAPLTNISMLVFQRVVLSLSWKMFCSIIYARNNMHTIKPLIQRTSITWLAKTVLCYFCIDANKKWTSMKYLNNSWGFCNPG